MEQNYGVDKRSLFHSINLFQNEGMIYGYARVSTDAQDLTNQVAQLKAAGCAAVFREKISGATAERPQLNKLMAKLAAGDVVVIPAVDRLSRDTTDLLVIARDMQRVGAGLRSIAEPVVDTTSDFAELVLAMLGVAAKLERRRIIERTARGRADAKAKGVRFGRKPKLTPHQQREAIKRRDVDGETLRSIGRSYNVSAQTISRLSAGR
jgi:DNA invertase Pin-like site-specific DNA recombinase